MPDWPRAVLFDFDGVIVNSEPLHFEAVRAALQRQNVELTEEEYFLELIGFDDKGTFRRVYEMRGLELSPKTLLALMATKVTIMRDLINRMRLDALPGVEQTVRELWRRVPLAIVSGARREEIELLLLGINLRDCFSFVIAAEDVTVGKPDPQGYLMAVSQIDERLRERGPHKYPLKPADCLVVEDALSVIRSVKKVGFPTLGVATSFGAGQLADADFVVESLRPEELMRQVPQLKLQG